MVKGRVRYGKLTSEAKPETGTEYGGVDGLIQPPPHDPVNVPRESLAQIYATNPAAGAITYVDGSTDVETEPIPITKKIR